MSAIADMLASLFGPYLSSPLLSSLLGTAMTLAIAFATSVGLYRMLQAIARRVAPGPVFMFGALVVAVSYTLVLVYLVANDKSFEQGVIDWLAGFTALPLDTLGPYQAPLLLSLFYAMMHAAYLLVVVLAAWAFGLFSQGEPGGVVREIEEELGTSYGMRFYKLCGYHRPDAPEKRFHAWASELGRVLRYAKWISFAGVITGSVPVALWVMGAVLYDGWQRNLTAPPEEPEEEVRPEEKQAVVIASVRDPGQLVHALKADERGPMLRIVGGGQIQGRAEHAAGKTRVKDESAVFADVLAALGIDAFYVHQEAAAEALLDGKDVLMETPPLSGRRTLCDVLAMRSVLLEGGTALYISPTKSESARRAKAFRDVAQQSNWRWAIFHHDLAKSGRDGIDLKLRQPQIVFTTPKELHDDLCRLHGDWDYFLQSLAMIVAIDLDRYGGPRGANLMYLMRRLMRAASAAGAEPRVLATVAPFGPDVQGFAERLVGRPLTVIGPESDSRGAPTQYVVVADGSGHVAVHAAVGTRGVAIACGYNAEIWGHGSVLTDFEQEQQVNKVLLEFDRAQVSSGDESDLRFDDADAIVARMSSDKAAMIPFFTRHAGRKALGIASLAALEVGKRRADERERPDIPFAGFQRFDDSADVGKKGEAVVAADEAQQEQEPTIELDDGADEPVDEAALAAALERQPDVAVSIWLADDDAFARYLAKNPGFVHPLRTHPMMKLGSKLVASPDNPAITVRHLLCAANETPITRAEAAELFSAEALDALIASKDDAAAIAVPERLVQRPRLRLGATGVIEQQDELVLEGELSSRGSTTVASIDTAQLVNRSGGEVILETDACRILAVAYPGRVLLRAGRRYRVLMREEQHRTGDGVVWAEPERRRIVTSRVRKLEVRFEGAGHELSLGGSAPIRFHHDKVELTETVLGVRHAQESRQYQDTLHYDEPVVVSYRTRAAIVQLPAGSAEAFEALERLVRITLPAFVRHAEEDMDVSVDVEHRRLLFVDRHPGGTGFARAVTSDVLRHVLYWSRVLVVECAGASCDEHDGCPDCLLGAPHLSTAPTASRRGARALLDQLLGA